MHALNLLNIALYGGSLLAYTYSSNPTETVFDKLWLQAGFCLQHEDIDYRTTHDLSGYAMVLIGLFGIAVQQFLSRRSVTEANNSKKYDMTKANDLTFWALVGALGHAFGHFLISHATRKNFYPPAQTTFLDDLLQTESMLEVIGKACPGYPLFWIPLVSTYMMNTAKGRVALVALVCWMGSLFMQVRFGFSYTQSVLFAGLSIDQLLLSRDDKDCFEYAMWPLITTLPNGAFAWFESLACSSSPIMQQHGHLGTSSSLLFLCYNCRCYDFIDLTQFCLFHNSVYDIYMASSYIVFYLICWFRANFIVVKSKTL